MLQQTQVATVLPYYAEWLRRFPDFNSLARAPENDVLHAWQGLGYYRRARNLHAAAKIISSKYRGKCPSNIGELQDLPGIGRYTAHAIAAFAFDQPLPVVDTNIGRVLARLFNLSAPIDSPAGREAVWSSATQLVPKRGARVFNSALMDLGAMICIPRAPKCGICPVRSFCRATNPALLPIKKAPPRTKKLSERHMFATKEGQLLMQKSTKRWRGMWILPPAISASARERAIHRSIFPFTHHQIKLKVFRQTGANIDHRIQRWMKIKTLNSIPIPSPHRRAIVELLAKDKTSLN